MAARKENGEVVGDVEAAGEKNQIRRATLIMGWDNERTMSCYESGTTYGGCWSGRGGDDAGAGGEGNGTGTGVSGEGIMVKLAAAGESVVIGGG